MHADMDVAPKGGLYSHDEKLCLDAKEDNLLEEDEEVYMVDTRGSLQHDQLTDITSQDVGVGDGSVPELT